MPSLLSLINPPRGCLEPVGRGEGRNIFNPEVSLRQERTQSPRNAGYPQTNQPIDMTCLKNQSSDLSLGRYGVALNTLYGELTLLVSVY